MAFILSTAARDAACNGIVDLIDGGAGAGSIKLYDGTQPANPQTALSGQTELAEILFSATAFGASSSGVATAADFTADTSTVAGTCTWGRVLDGDGVDVTDVIFDLDCGNGTGTLAFSPTNVFATGGTADITSMTVTVPAS